MSSSKPTVPAPVNPVFAIPYQDEVVAGHVEVGLTPEYAQLLLTLMEKTEELRAIDNQVMLVHRSDRVRFAAVDQDKASDELLDLLEPWNDDAILADAKDWESIEVDEATLSLEIFPNAIAARIEQYEKHMGTLVMGPGCEIRKGDILHYLLRVAPDTEVPVIFQKIAQDSPKLALKVLENGGRIECEEESMGRDITSMLREKDLVPLLSSEDSEVRVSTIALVGQVKKEEPTPPAQSRSQVKR